MKVILKRTLQETLKLSTVILVVVVAFLCGQVMLSNSSYYSIPAYESYLDSVMILQHAIVFFVINGAVLLATVASVSTGLIAGEVHEGTFRLLAAKPNSRTSILTGKILGMAIGTVILMLLGLSTLYAVEIMLGKFDASIVSSMLKYVPGYILYGLIASLFFSSLGVLLSCIAKKRIFALLPLLALIIMVLALPIIIRASRMIFGSEENMLFNIIDMNYHFSSIFKWCIDLCGGISGRSGELEVLQILMNLYKYEIADIDVVREFNTVLVENRTLPALGILIVYLGLSIANYTGSYLIIKRKDV